MKNITKLTLVSLSIIYSQLDYSILAVVTPLFAYPFEHISVQC
jgi:hypothetical protein